MNIDTSSAISVSVRTSDYSLEYMQRLRSFAASRTALEAAGYVLQPLTESAIERKRRCERCGKSEFARTESRGWLLTICSDAERESRC